MTVLKNINSWKTKTQSMKDRIKSSATSYVQRQVLAVLKEAVRVSPQWSGNYAANWKLEVNRQQGHYDPIFKQANWQDIRPPKYAGHPAAIAAAMAYSGDEYIKGLIKWNSVVRLVNYSPTAALIDSGEVKLRPENLVYAPEGVIAYLNMKYKYLGKL